MSEMSTFTQLFETPTVNSNAVSSHFRFLDFPREIRDAVYKELVQVFDVSKDHRPPRTRMTYLEILRVNHQIHQESKYVFLQANLFVKITSCPSIKIPPHCFCSHPEKFQHFKDFVI